MSPPQTLHTTFDDGKKHVKIFNNSSCYGAQFGERAVFDAQSAGEVFVTVQYDNPGGTEWQKPPGNKQLRVENHQLKIT